MTDDFIAEHGGVPKLPGQPKAEVEASVTDN